MKRATRTTTAPLASMPCERSQLVLAGRLFMRAVCRLTAAAGFSSSGCGDTLVLGGLALLHVHFDVLNGSRLHLDVVGEAEHEGEEQDNGKEAEVFHWCSVSPAPADR